MPPHNQFSLRIEAGVGAVDIQLHTTSTHRLHQHCFGVKSTIEGRDDYSECILHRHRHGAGGYGDDTLCSILRNDGTTVTSKILE